MKCSREMVGNCDMSKCATITKEECAKMCDSLGCTPEEKEICLSHYGADGKFIASNPAKSCCAKKETTDKTVKIEITNSNNKAKATVTTSQNGANQMEVFEGSLEEVKAKIEALK
jgi:K(+)-stimulated pyrophosphate-energized sodium pump